MGDQRAEITSSNMSNKMQQAAVDCAVEMGDQRAEIKSSDMSNEMQQAAVDCAKLALENLTIEKDIASFIKTEFDTKYNPTWHCVVGRNFGSYVTTEQRHFVHFSLEQVDIMLYKK